MNRNDLIHLIAGKGWKRIQQNSEYFEVPFEIISNRWFTLAKWYILISITNELTKDNITMYQKIFKHISRNSKSWIWGRCFLYGIMANKIDPEIIHVIKRDSFGLYGVFRLKGGGGNIFLVDLSQKVVYGEVPPLPYDAHKFSKGFKEILHKIL